MKKIVALIAVLVVAAAASISIYALGAGTKETAEPQTAEPQTTESQTTESQIDYSSKEVVSEVVLSQDPQTDVESALPDAPVTPSFADTKDEIVYKMLNSVDYFSTASVQFSSLFPGFDTNQNYTIETNLDTGVAHQVCSDNLIETNAENKAEAYETYSDGNVVREYNNLERTVRTICSSEGRRTLAEEWPDENERYYIDENGEPHYRYRSNPTNADMAGECLFPQVAAFAYLMEKDLWEVTDTIEYCGRQCYSIEGTVNDSYSAQIGADTFMMYVDKATGILLMLEARGGDGSIVSSMVVSEISIDAPATYTSFQYDMSKYEGYTELSD